MLLNLTKNEFYFVPEAFCGLEYAENKMRLWPGICPGFHRGSLRRSPEPPSRLGRAHPSQT